MPVEARPIARLSRETASRTQAGGRFFRLIAIGHWSGCLGTPRGVALDEATTGEHQQLGRCSSKGAEPAQQGR